LHVARYEVLDLIGPGAFGTVYRARHIELQIQVALRVVPKSNLRTMKEFHLLQRQVSLIQALDHPFIVTFYEAFCEGDTFYLAMELADNGNLRDFIVRHGVLAEHEACRLFYELMLVLVYLHGDRHICTAI
jgi:serine/threonine protein kinase